nr:MAG TPA: hypothetical protein [Caudoviricetes sp.]
MGMGMGTRSPHSLPYPTNRTRQNFERGEM